MELTQQQRFEALKMRYEDQVKLLRFMTKLDAQIFGVYFTLQLAFGSFLVRLAPPPYFGSRIGIATIDFTLALIAFIFLHNNFRRRKEAGATLKNVMTAIGFYEAGIYLSTPLNAASKYRAWGPWYVAGIVLAFAGVMLVLFTGLKA
jgi:hypothetical protein